MHPTIKPVELIRRPILYHTQPGELIYEPFCGSGTAIIAAEMTQPPLLRARARPAVRRRRCDHAGSDYTGKQATLEGDGRSFAEIAAERSSSQPEGR